MADVKVIKDGRGQIELNRCSFLHDGNIESQCLAAEDLDNGMIVAIDKVAGTVSKVTKGAEADTSKVYGVNYTAERIYDQFKPGRKNFFVEGNKDYPRVGILKAGDIFSTNAYLVNETNAPEEGSVETYGGVKLRVVEITDTADGQTAVKYQVL
jgi:hypothetical protein